MVPGVGEEAEMDDRGLEPTTVPTGSATDRSSSQVTRRRFLQGAGALGVAGLALPNRFSD